MTNYDYSSFLTDAANAAFIKVTPSDPVGPQYRGVINGWGAEGYVLETPVSVPESSIIFHQIQAAFDALPRPGGKPYPTVENVIISGTVGSPDQTTVCLYSQDALDRLIGPYIQ